MTHRSLHFRSEQAVLTEMSYFPTFISFNPSGLRKSTVLDSKRTPETLNSQRKPCVCSQNQNFLRIFFLQISKAAPTHGLTAFVILFTINVVLDHCTWTRPINNPIQP